MKKNYLLFPLLLFLVSCAEEVSRDISTDSIQESRQFFTLTQAVWESNYLGNISFSEYNRITSSELPGCPKLTRSTTTRTVELDYSQPQECTQENLQIRKGKIIIDFSLSNNPNPSWRLTYVDYSYGSTKIQGTRVFKPTSVDENEESLENFRIELEKNLGFTLNGSLSHSFSRLNFRPFALSSRGILQGRNPAGRDYSITVTTSKEQTFFCYRRDQTLPYIGGESWIVSRGINRGIEYKVSYQESTNCESQVLATFPDGQIVQLNP